MSSNEPRSDGLRSLEAGVALFLFSAFLAIAWLVYEPALRGPPISDDFGYLLSPYVTEISVENTVEILNPVSQATRSLNNYAPLRALVNTLEYWLFGQNSYPYHVVNLVLHASASVLLVALLVSLGVAQGAAILGGTLFLTHPASVEAVAWMSQVWSPLALALALGALLLRERVALGSLLFALALLTKPTAAAVLPVAAVLQWNRRPRSGAQDPLGGKARPGSAWLAIWLGLFLLYAVAEFATFILTESGASLPLHPDLGVRLRSIVAIAARYLALATTSFGASTFHEPPPAISLLDPWWLAGLAAVGILGWRTFATLRRRRDEAAFWLWAAAAFAPVSQVFPFLYPMADRYLYFMLPGLIGAPLLGGGEWLGARARDVRLAVALAAAAVALAGFFGIRSHERAGIWRHEDLVLADAARHYPDGVPANLLRARAAARLGDVDGTLAALRRCRDRGWDFYTNLLSDPSYAPLRTDPEFTAFVEELAGDLIKRIGALRWPTQMELSQAADLHELRGETAGAIEVLEQALALSGPLDPQLRAQLGRLRAARRRGSPQRDTR